MECGILLFFLAASAVSLGIYRYYTMWNSIVLFGSKCGWFRGRTKSGHYWHLYVEFPRPFPAYRCKRNCGPGPFYGGC